MKYLSLCLTILFLSMGCSTEKAISEEKMVIPPEFMNIKWILQDDGQDFQGLQGREITMEYNPETEQISGFSGCNNYFSTGFGMGASKFVPGKLAMTKMYCPNLPEEQKFLELLQTADNYKIEGDNLYLYKGSLVLLSFKKGS